MKIYYGMKEEAGHCPIRIKNPDTGGIKKLGLQASLDIRSHSPSGFAWGYGGSGPSQTALAILIDCVGKDLAIKHYQEFKWQFVSKWVDGFEISDQKIINWINVQEEKDNPGDILKELNHKVGDGKGK